MSVDVQDLDADFYVMTGHKTYGPSGIGVLYGRLDHLERMPPYQGGGEMIGEVTTDRITYAEPPHRFEAGTPAFVQAIGLGAALDYMLRGRPRRHRGPRRRASATTRPIGWERSIRCGSSARRGRRALSSPSPWTVRTRMMSRR